jgi:hypothetical protein
MGNSFRRYVRLLHQYGRFTDNAKNWLKDYMEERNQTRIKQQ